MVGRQAALPVFDRNCGSVCGRLPTSQSAVDLATFNQPFLHQCMTTEIRNWAVVAAAMEAQGATNSDMYRRAKALASGEADPMPTSFPAAPFSISAA